MKGTRRDLGIIIDVDKITADLGGNMIKGGRAAVEKIRDCLKRGISFTQETTLSGHMTAQTAKKARDAGYSICMYYIAIDTAQESILRIENRVKRGGHDIAQQDVLRRFASRWSDLQEVLPYCDRAEFYDNGNGFVKVAEYQNGELLPIGNKRPQWLDELLLAWDPDFTKLTPKERRELEEAENDPETNPFDEIDWT